MSVEGGCMISTWLYQSALNIKVRRVTFILRQDAALVPALILIATIIGYDPSDVMHNSWYYYHSICKYDSNYQLYLMTNIT